MSKSTERRRRRVRAVVLPLAMLSSAGLVWQASHEAFTASTTSPNNSWSAATVTLQNDTDGSYKATGTLMFNVTDAVPGNTGSWCVNVKNASTVDATAANPVKFFAPPPTTSDLAPYVNLQVVEGTGATGGAAGSCTSFVAGTTVFNSTMSSLSSNYASATAPAGTGAIAKGASKSYKLTWTLDPATPDSAQGKTLTGVAFTWAVQVSS